MKVYIGYDAAEHLAVQVAQRTLLAARKGPWGVDHESILLVQEDLRARGLYTRPEVVQNGQRYDVLSKAPCSTAFSLTRFLVPILRLSGLALFLDCDMAFRESPIVMLQPQANGIAGRIGSQVAGQPDPSTMHQQQLQAMLHGAQMAVSNLVAMAEEIKKLVNGDEPNAAETLES